MLLRNNDETSWQKTSASLDASAKIYGYRVDLVHTETFKMLGGLDRAKEKADEKNEENPEEDSKGKKAKKEKVLKNLTYLLYYLETLSNTRIRSY